MPQCVCERMCPSACVHLTKSIPKEQAGVGKFRWYPIAQEQKCYTALQDEPRATASTAELHAHFCLSYEPKVS